MSALLSQELSAVHYRGTLQASYYLLVSKLYGSHDLSIRSAYKKPYSTPLFECTL